MVDDTKIVKPDIAKKQGRIIGERLVSVCVAFLCHNIRTEVSAGKSETHHRIRYHKRSIKRKRGKKETNMRKTLAGIVLSCVLAASLTTGIIVAIRVIHKKRKAA